MPATAPLAPTVTLIDDTEFHTFVAEVLAAALGVIAFGVEHDTAITNALLSPLTFGIDPPLTATA